MKAAVSALQHGGLMVSSLFSPADFSVLQRAIDMALMQAEGRTIELSVGHLAATLCAAFHAGERDPQRLAAAVFVERDGVGAASRN